MSERALPPPPSAEAAGGRWPAGPEQPRLEPGAVHVWRADLRDGDEQLADSLSEHERVRAAQIVGERERRLWSTSRGLLRTLLGRYLQLDPGSLALIAGAHGKPALHARAGVRALYFNMSHSGHLALFAFCEDGEVGVDVQLARTDDAARDFAALARRAFGEEAAQYLQRLASREREREFVRRWTGYEAELKQRGVGIGVGRAHASEHAGWVGELDIGADGAAAVACARRPRELSCWAWAG
jgi:4'-phosphopantetheinyl transferase